MILDSIYRGAPIWVQTLMLNAYATGLIRYRRGASFRRFIDELAVSERWDRSRLQAYQDERLRRIVRIAYDRSPYYRELMSTLGLTPDEVRGVADLPRLPLLTKETLRSRLDDILTARRPARDWRHGHTSGTTGSPLSLWYDRETCVVNDAVDHRQKRWAGMKDEDWIGVLLGRVVVPTAQVRPPFWRVNHVLRQVWFSSFHMSPDNLPRYVAEVRRRGLCYLEGYPSTLFVLAQHLQRRGESLPMRAVFTSSETLHRVQRETIEAAFGCPVFDFYGHAERAIFATECEAHEGKHIAEEYGFVEVVNHLGTPVPDGEPGLLVGTSLHNAAMPMLRYRTGDISILRRDRCACGRTLIRMEDVATKAEDIVVTPDGRMVSPSVLTHPFKPFPQILKSQLIQERLDRVIVKVVPSESFTADHQAQLTRELRSRLGQDMEIAVQLVDDIPRDPSGKFRWVVSRVSHPSHFNWDDGAA